MHISHHADQRLNQRGISRRLVDFALRHGRVEGGDTLITAYNVRPHVRRPRGASGHA